VIFSVHGELISLHGYGSQDIIRCTVHMKDVSLVCHFKQHDTVVYVCSQQYVNKQPLFEIQN